MKKRIIFFIINHFLSGTKFFELKRTLLNCCGFKVGRGSRIVGPMFVSTKLTIGSDCWIGKNFICNGNGSVTIGNNCDIGPEVTFQTGGHKIGGAERRAGVGVRFNQTVGNGTWICGRSTIIGETIVGNSCVIAGCACVTKDVPDNTLVGGVPAKEIRKL